MMWLAQVALLLAPFAGPAAPDSDVEQLRKIKLELWPKAYREQDVALLDRLLDDSFQMIDGEGSVTNKTEELAWIRKNKPSYERFEYSIERLDIYEGTSAIVAGMGTIHTKRDRKPAIVRYRSTNMLIKKNGVWRAIASHVSDVPEKNN